DDSFYLKLISSVLEKDGWSVIQCNDVEFALKILDEEDSPDVIIIDLYMPKIDGWHLCKLLRSPEFPNTDKIPILMISSSFSGKDIHQMSLEVGANAFLEIPFKANDLKNYMMTLLKGETPPYLKQVVIIDNDMIQIELIKQAFERHNYKVDVAYNSKDGSSLINKYSPQFVIVNYTLQDSLEDDLIYSIKKPDALSVAIIMTEEISPTLAIQFLKKGADAYITKPFNAEDLIGICQKSYHERSLLRIDALLEERTRKLKESEEKFRTLFENSRDAIYFSTRNGSILDVNQAALNLFGYSRDEMLTMNTRDLYVNPEDREKFQRDIEEKKGVSDYEEKLIKKDGSEIDCLISSSIRYDNDGSVLGYQGIIRNITDRKKMQAELLKMEKLESINILAGGIAHDFNNILTAILGNLSLAKIFAKSDNMVLEKLEEAEKASLRAKGLTQQLLTFSKAGEPIKRRVSIENILMDSTKFAPIDPKVSCNLSISEDLWLVEIDEAQISQVLNNIIINADQAMPAGGTIQITASNVEIDSKTILPLVKGKYVNIMLKDEGIGIEKKHLEKIFDPYYTTWRERSGLGLASAYSIVKNHNGYITVESDVGRGTTFCIYLPAFEKEITKENPELVRPSKGTGKILIMDDEEIIRDIAENMLKYIGYDVEKAVDGTEAIKHYIKAIEKNEPFDAIIMDLTIPNGMGGKDTVTKLLDIDPEIKAIVSSGYSNDPIMSNFRKYGFKGVISKPYKIEELSKVINQVITEE
ncbi:response regulator, partial [bacterium]|nr:response regulator [bacterium]